MTDGPITETSPAVDTVRTDEGRLPFAVHLDLTVQDSDTIAELFAYPEGESRERYALEALRIGVLALRQARGQLDADLIRNESDRLLTGMQSRLEEHSRAVHDRLTVVLKEYFDPKSGRFQERVERLVSEGGELETLLRRQVGTEDSELYRTLTSHIGEDSPLLKHLSPDESKGVLAALRETLEGQLRAQREQVLNQFSLDEEDGALSRFIGELSKRQGELSDQLGDKINEVVREFSLDDDDSALSRLVRNVDRAQKTITNEFSLDEDQSALSRLKKLLEDTNAAIDRQLSLDDEQSPLARLQRELKTVLEEQREHSQKFQEEVKVAIESLVTRRKEADRSTRHGLDFEDAVGEFLSHDVQGTGDMSTPTGNTTGMISNCKVGDFVVRLGPESAAPDANVVIEAKEAAGYSLQKMRDEIETARKNRDARIGVFVMSTKTAPEGLEPFARYGDDVVVVWDAEDGSTDVYLNAALSLARALCVRDRVERESKDVDFSEIDRAVLQIEKQADALEKIRKPAESISKSAETILDELRKREKQLRRQISILRDQTTDLKESLVEIAE